MNLKDFDLKDFDLKDLKSNGKFLLERTFYYFGTVGPIFLFFLSLFFLRNKSHLSFYYVIGFFMNAILNIVLKGIIKQPRPSEDPEKFKIALKNQERVGYRNGLPYDIFGMPSGHAESSFFSVGFIYFTIRNMNLVGLYLVLSLLILFQRVIYNYHTILQVVVGSVVGLLFGYFVFQIAQEEIKGDIREKPDEDAPI